LDEAEEELFEAMMYYEDRRQGLGADFYDRVAETMRNIGEYPLQFPIYEGQRSSREFRRARVARFPYIVVYETRETEILVVAVAHTSRDAGYWEHRGKEG
jgi:plasmid stabilization system protein ParE